METDETVQTPLNQADAAPPARAPITPEAIFSRFNAEHSAEEASQPAPETTPAPQVTAAPTQQAETVETPQKPEEVMSPQKLKWNELKSKADELDTLKSTVLPSKEKELEALKARVEQMSAVDAQKFQAEIKAREEQINQYERKLAVFDVRESAEFRSEIIAPMTKIASDIDRIGASYGVDAQALKDALTIADPKAQRERIEQLTADFSDLHKNKIWGAVDATQEIYEKAARIEQNAFEAKKEMEFVRQQEAEKSKQEQQQKLTSAQRAVEQQFRDKMPDLFANEEVAKDILNVDLANDDPIMRAYNAMAGRALIHKTKEARALQAKVKELEGALAARSSVSPKAGGGQGNQQAEVAPKGVYQGSNMWERAKAAGLA